MDEFRALLRSRLSERGALARLSKASGIASHVIGRWRDGEGRPTDTNLKRLAPALGVPYEALAQMCDYMPGEPVVDVDPRLGAFLAAIGSGWQEMDETTREVAERGTRALFARRAAVNTADAGTANSPGAASNGRRGTPPPLLKSQKEWGAVAVLASLLASLLAPILTFPGRWARPFRESAAATA